jgi:GntR family transcriptional regulator, rspAB operon transcriptional repressor
MKGFRPDPTASRAPTDVSARRAYTELRSQILDGRLPPGAVVSEVAMAESIGVSRTPLREALRELLSEGLIVGDGPRRQVTVRQLSRDELDEIVRARRALEGVIATSVAEAVDDEAIDALRLISARMTRAAVHGDAAGFLEADDEFHAALSRASAMTTVEEFLARLRSLSRLAAMTGEPQQALLAEVGAAHERIIDLLAARGPRRGRQLATELGRCADALAAMGVGASRRHDAR